MSHVLSFFKSDYITAVELGDKKSTLTISGVKAVQLEDEKGKMRDRPVVAFRETPRAWVLCKTTALCVAAMFGDETDGWVGKRVTLHSEMVQVGPERRPGLRVSGSPDITKEIKLQIKLPKRKAFIVTLVPTGKAAPVTDPVPAAPPENTRTEATA